MVQPLALAVRVRCAAHSRTCATEPGAEWLYVDRVAQAHAALFAQARKRLNVDGSVTRGGKVRAARPADCSDRYHWGTPYNVGCAAFGWLRPAPALRAAPPQAVRAGPAGMKRWPLPRWP